MKRGTAKVEAGVGGAPRGAGSDGGAERAWYQWVSCRMHTFDWKAHLQLAAADCTRGVSLLLSETSCPPARAGIALPPLGKEPSRRMGLSPVSMSLLSAMISPAGLPSSSSSLLLHCFHCQGHNFSPYPVASESDQTSPDRFTYLVYRKPAYRQPLNG